MFCKNCGKTLIEGEMFCTTCGAKVESKINENNVNQVNYNEQNQLNNVYQNQNYNYGPIKNKNNTSKIVGIICGIIGAIIVLIIVILSIASSKADKLVCKSSEGNITIKYNESGIIGYAASGISYDLETQKQTAKQMGIEEYLVEFNKWFTTNTSGSCTIDGKEVSKDEIKDQTSNNNKTETIEDSKRVGEDNYGYVTVPKNWAKFYDASASALQYSYASVYIISLDYIEDSQLSAKTAASNYMYNKQNSTDVTGVTGATVKIGKNKEYTAYQVYMYYPSDDTYLITYWFEAEDNKVHYIALEGPGELSDKKIEDYLSIPESFSLKS